MRLRTFEMINSIAPREYRRSGTDDGMPTMCHDPSPIRPRPNRLGRCGWLLRRLSQSGAAGRRVLLHVKQRLRKAAKIVDGTRIGHGGEPCAARFPVRGDAQNGVRLGYFACRRANRTTEFGVGDGVHRTAVA